MSSIRDAVIWGYALFAVATAGIIVSTPSILRWILLRYRSLVTIFISLAGLLFLLNQAGIFASIRIPGTDIEVLDLKGGDMMVHLAGAAAFLAVGMVRRRALLMLLLILDLGLIITSNRGGMVAFMGAMVVLLIMQPSRLRLMAPIVVISFLAATLLLVDVRLDVGGRREISTEQLAENMKSLVGSSSQSSLEGTEEWRLSWWGDIVNYTFGGRYFLFGKGYGINLATADGYQVTEQDELRSPHNGHMSILARSGVPGFFLWILFCGVWLLRMLGAARDARKADDLGWHGIFTFLICYWTAFLINASFDVYLEGPMGGIWFWSVVGIGIGAEYVYRTAPHVGRDERVIAQMEVETA